VSFCLFSGGSFFDFRAIFAYFGQFRLIFGVDFPLFDVFSSFRYGILDPRMAPCTMAHPKRLLKPRNWAPELTGFFTFVQLVDLALNALFPWAELTQQPVVSTRRTCQWYSSYSVSNPGCGLKCRFSVCSVDGP
jgi:hypothetical protein